jgi:hypothetical protein
MTDAQQKLAARRDEINHRLAEIRHARRGEEAQESDEERMLLAERRAIEIEAIEQHEAVDPPDDWESQPREPAVVNDILVEDEPTLD